MSIRQWRFALPNGARFVNGPDGYLIVQFPEGWEKAILTSLSNQLDHYRRTASPSPAPAPRMGLNVETVQQVEPDTQVLAPPAIPQFNPAKIQAPPATPGPTNVAVKGASGATHAQFARPNGPILRPPPIPPEMQSNPVPVIPAPALPYSPEVKASVQSRMTRSFNPLMPGHRAPDILPPPMPIASPEPGPAKGTVSPAQQFGDASVQAVAVMQANNNKIEVDPSNPARGKLTGPVVILPQPAPLKPPRVDQSGKPIP